MWRNTCKASEVPLKGVIEAKSFESGRQLNFDVHRQKFTPKKPEPQKPAAYQNLTFLVQQNGWCPLSELRLFNVASHPLFERITLGVTELNKSVG